MKTSGIITFLLELLLGLALLITSMGMEAVLKTTSFFIGYSAVTIIIALVLFILSINSKNSKVFGIVSCASIVIALIALFVSRIFSASDSKVYADLLNKHDVTIATFFITLIIQIIMGIINTILGFSNKKVNNE